MRITQAMLMMAMNTVGRDVPEGVLETRIPKFLDLLAQYGYALTPATPAIARHMARVALAKEHDMPRRSLMLAGSVGTGKTTALNIMAAAFDWDIFMVGELAGKFAAHGAAWLEEELLAWSKKTIALDDLGAETEMKNYGAAFPAQYLIERRYDAWKYYGTLTYFTTNLTETERKDRYGIRVAERLAEMCEIVPCCWKSFRRVRV